MKAIYNKRTRDVIFFCPGPIPNVDSDHDIYTINAADENVIASSRSGKFRVLDAGLTILAPSVDELRQKAKAHRDKLISEGFSFQGKVIQTRNQTDIDNVNGAAIKATNDSTFTTGWIAADNSILPLDASGVIAMQATMLDRGNAIFATYVAKVTEIANATEEQRKTLDPEFTV